MSNRGPIILSSQTGQDTYREGMYRHTTRACAERAYADRAYTGRACTDRQSVQAVMHKGCSHLFQIVVRLVRQLEVASSWQLGEVLHGGTLCLCQHSRKRLMQVTLMQHSLGCTTFLLLYGGNGHCTIATAHCCGPGVIACSLQLSLIQTAHAAHAAG